MLDIEAPNGHRTWGHFRHGCFVEPENSHLMKHDHWTRKWFDSKQIPGGQRDAINRIRKVDTVVPLTVCLTIFRVFDRQGTNVGIDPTGSRGQFLGFSVSGRPLRPNDRC